MNEQENSARNQNILATEHESEVFLLLSRLLSILLPTSNDVFAYENLEWENE